VREVGVADERGREVARGDAPRAHGGAALRVEGLRQRDDADARGELEIDRRLEDFARRLMDQNVDPRKAGIDWNAFRESQREVSREAVAAALALDEVTRREKLDVTDAEVEAEVVKYAERTGRTPAAVRAALDKEGGLSRIYAGLRREKSIDFVMAHATITEDS